MKLEPFVVAFEQIVEDRHIDREIVEEALKEAIVKAFRKHTDVNDALAEVVVDNGNLRLFRLYEVVEEVEDDALQVQLDELEEGHNYKVGDFLREEHNIEDLGRAAALQAKQVLKQKIREAEKQAIYDEYIDQKDEMLIGEVESVEERFVIVNLGKALAIMPKAQQMPNEVYQEGQRLRVIITDVVKDTKGAQIVASRADANLVKRLFEKEVPEIFDGIVEIRAIAREAGERTKMAVYSHNSDVDPIGACIGPKGSRVQVVIEELKGEKIDIFEWSENTIELIKNALSPAVVTAVYPDPEKRGLVVVVEDNQLSLAIGKRGKNARLAVRLTKQKIDIKSLSEVIESGVDYQGLMAEYQNELNIKLAEAKAKEAQARLDAIAAQQEQEAHEQEEVVETPVEVDETAAIVQEVVEEEKVEPQPEPKEEIEVQPESEVKKPKRTIRQKQEYVSKFEELADASKSKQQTQSKRKKRKSNSEDDLKRVNTAELLAEMKYDIKPTYTDEELEELDNYNDDWFEEDDIDYDEFDDFYDQD